MSIPDLVHFAIIIKNLYEWTLVEVIAAPVKLIFSKPAFKTR